MKLAVEGILPPMRTSRLMLPVGCLLLLLLACQLPTGLNQSVNPVDTAKVVHLITVGPNASPTNTPFQPVANTPTVTPTSTPTQTPTATMTATPTATNTPEPLPNILVGAGDISICDRDGDNHTSELLASIPGAIYTLGDNSNQNGAMSQYTDCFNYSWGRYMARLYPVPGNHDYNSIEGGNYYDYFGARAGEYGKGYYSYEVGSWHIIALNSVIDTSNGSEQAGWLRADLAAHPAACTLAYWHYPRWSSGAEGNIDEMGPFVQILYDYGADVVLSAHDHIYERFAPQNPAGELDIARGIREFVVGTGGASHHGFGEIKANSEVRDSTSFGVLMFTLYENSYTWEFIPIRGDPFTDSGSDTCH
jgi:hypothetical protein